MTGNNSHFHFFFHSFSFANLLHNAVTVLWKVKETSSPFPNAFALAVLSHFQFHQYFTVTFGKTICRNVLTSIHFNGKLKNYLSN